MSDFQICRFNEDVICTSGRISCSTCEYEKSFESLFGMSAEEMIEEDSVWFSAIYDSWQK
jgi:hypothetical protein